MQHLKFRFMFRRIINDYRRNRQLVARGATWIKLCNVLAKQTLSWSLYLASCYTKNIIHRAQRFKQVRLRPLL